MVEYLETVLESGSDTPNNQVTERSEDEMPNSADRKKHLSQDSAGRTHHTFLSGVLGRAAAPSAYIDGSCSVPVYTAV